jgi:hypothetical protein
MTSNRQLPFVWGPCRPWEWPLVAPITKYPVYDHASRLGGRNGTCASIGGSILCWRSSRSNHDRIAPWAAWKNACGRLLISGSQVRVLVRRPIKSSTYKTGERSIFPPFETGKDIGRQCRVRVLLLLWSSGRRHPRHMASHVRRVVGSSD